MLGTEEELSEAVLHEVFEASRHESLLVPLARSFSMLNERLEHVLSSCLPPEADKAAALEALEIEVGRALKQGEGVCDEFGGVCLEQIDASFSGSGRSAADGLTPTQWKAHMSRRIEEVRLGCENDIKVADKKREGEVRAELDALKQQAERAEKRYDVLSAEIKAGTARVGAGGEPLELTTPGTLSPVGTRPLHPSEVSAAGQPLLRKHAGFGAAKVDDSRPAADGGGGGSFLPPVAKDGSKGGAAAGAAAERPDAAAHTSNEAEEAPWTDEQLERALEKALAKEKLSSRALMKNPESNARLRQGKGGARGGRSGRGGQKQKAGAYPEPPPMGGLVDVASTPAAVATSKGTMAALVQHLVREEALEQALRALQACRVARPPAAAERPLANGGGAEAGMGIPVELQTLAQQQMFSRPLVAARGGGLGEVMHQHYGYGGAHGGAHTAR